MGLLKKKQKTFICVSMCAYTDGHRDQKKISDP